MAKHIDMTKARMLLDVPHEAYLINWRAVEKWATTGYECKSQPTPKYRIGPPVKGVGSHLHDIIKLIFGQDAHAGCGCASLVAEMNRRGVEGCKRDIDRLTGLLIERATKKNWTIQHEADIEVPEEDIGKPVPQTIRTRIMRLTARAASKLPGGSAINHGLCLAMIEWAILRAEATAHANDSLYCRSD
jgi:hypothetical protein